MTTSKWDIFISYSHEDKYFVDRLADLLFNMGLKVWYDSFELELGDSLTKKINEGLSQSTFGVVILSRSFFQKDWTQLEIGALLNREINHRKVILPVWHDISSQELTKAAPLLLDKLSASSENSSVETIAQQILKIVKPDRFVDSRSLKPIEIEWYNDSQMILLPIFPSHNSVIALGKYPVTNKQYKAYLNSVSKLEQEEIEYRIRSFNGFKNRIQKLFKQPQGKSFKNNEWILNFRPWEDENFNHPEKPVVCISSIEASSYACWLNLLKQRTKYSHSLTVLPSTKIWDYAAFGKLFPDRNPSSWLNTAKSFHHSMTSPIEVINAGERFNARGLSDMFGNVWEWCKPHTTRDNTISKIGFSREEIISAELRGGSYLDNLNNIAPFLTTSILEDGIFTRHSDLGFRIASIINLKDLDKDAIEKLWTMEHDSYTFLKEYDGIEYA